MCGLAGYLNLNGRPASLAVVKAMTQKLVHRGPDGEGHFIDRTLALGHRRLAILDLTDRSRQPMATPDGRFVLSYNGELYNFLELRQELESRGHVFQSTGDTEVVLRALAEWDTAALPRFNGMFALALWDRREGSLLLARDRFGVKPLYHATFDGAFAFASEIKAFLAHPEFQVGIDRAGLVEYFTFQNFFTDRTLFKNVRLLPPASWMRVQPSGKMAVSRYWDYDFVEPSTPPDEAELLENLDDLFVRAVRRQLVSDVEIGAYLSGGMDSGSITAIAAREFPYLKSFTCGFDVSSASGIEQVFDERAAAERMSARYRTEHYEMVLKSGDMERVMNWLVWHLEEPRVGQCYPNFYAARLASKFVKVVLSGAGGDEIFGGYPWRYYRAVAVRDFDDYVDRYYEFWQRLIPDTSKMRVFAPIGVEAAQISTRDIFESVFPDQARRLSRPVDYINNSLYFEAKTFLHGLLVVEDKMSMAHSLETRVPFLDNDLVDFAMGLPAAQRLGNLTSAVSINENEFASKKAHYYQKYNDGKLLLRKMMLRHIPPEVAQREKQGFSAPDATWFKGESIEYVRRLLFGGETRLYEYMDSDAVQGLVQLHLDGRENKRLLIWSLLYFETLLRTFVPDEAERRATAIAQNAPAREEMLVV